MVIFNSYVKLPEGRFYSRRIVFLKVQKGNAKLKDVESTVSTWQSRSFLEHSFRRIEYPEAVLGDAVPLYLI